MSWWRFGVGVNKNPVQMARRHEAMDMPRKAIQVLEREQLVRLYPELTDAVDLEIEAIKRRCPSWQEGNDGVQDGKRISASKAWNHSMTIRWAVAASAVALVGVLLAALLAAVIH